eukprot:196395-Ditylum_brightwellii.AAC.1
MSWPALASIAGWGNKGRGIMSEPQCFICRFLCLYAFFLAASAPHHLQTMNVAWPNNSLSLTK